MSKSELAPEIPALLKQKPVKKKVAKNVWRLWLKDTPQDEEQAFKKDIEVDFNPELFIKDPNDIKKCLDILQQNFGILQIIYLQGLANSPRTFPEIGAHVFIEMMMRHQSAKDAERLPRARIEGPLEVIQDPNWLERFAEENIWKRFSDCAELNKRMKWKYQWSPII